MAKTVVVSFSGTVAKVTKLHAGIQVKGQTQLIWVPKAMAGIVDEPKKATVKKPVAKKAVEA